MTVGYYNTRQSDGYLPIARLFKRHKVVLNFTCFEMKDQEKPKHSKCSIDGLLDVDDDDTFLVKLLKIFSFEVLIIIPSFALDFNGRI